MEHIVGSAAVYYVAGYSTHLPDIYGKTSITVVGSSCLIFKDGQKEGVVILDKGAQALLLAALSSGSTGCVISPNSWLTIDYDDRGGILLTLPWVGGSSITLAARPHYLDGETISVFVEYHDIKYLVNAIARTTEETAPNSTLIAMEIEV